MAVGKKNICARAVKMPEKPRKGAFSAGGLRSRFPLPPAENASPRAGAGGAAAGAGGVSETRPRHAFDCCEVYNVSFKPSDAPELAAIICNEVYDEVFKAASC